MSLASHPPNYEPVARLQNEFKNKGKFIEEAIGVLEPLVLSQLPRGAHILDLGCGCGYLVQQLHRRGYKMTGIDASEGLLRYARINAPESEFILDDIRKFELPPTFNAVLSIDVLLFILNNEDLTAVFQNVYASLLESGLFVFSIPFIEVMHERTQEGYFNHIYVNDECAFLELFYYKHEENIWEIKVTGFEFIKETWKRSDTTWFRKDHFFSEVRSALEKVGFIEIVPSDVEDMKVKGLGGFVCRKPSASR